MRIVIYCQTCKQKSALCYHLLTGNISFQNTFYKKVSSMFEQKKFGQTHTHSCKHTHFPLNIMHMHTHYLPDSLPDRTTAYGLKLEGISFKSQIFPSYIGIPETELLSLSSKHLFGHLSDPELHFQYLIYFVLNDGFVHIQHICLLFTLIKICQHLLGMYCI